MRIKKIYLAGAISNNPNYELDFDNAELLMIRKGFGVINPVKIIKSLIEKSKNKELSHRSIMLVLIPYLFDSDGIYLMPNWIQSDGAVLEYQIAKYLQKRNKDYLIFKTIEVYENIIENDIDTIVNIINTNKLKRLPYQLSDYQAATKVVYDAFAIKTEDARNRERHIVTINHCLAYVYRMDYNLTSVIIGKILQRHHTTILHSVKLINEQMNYYYDVKSKLEAVKKILAGALK